MTTLEKSGRIIMKEDYDLLVDFLKTKKNVYVAGKLTPNRLLEELETAQVVPKEVYPKNAVCINSVVKLREKKARYNFTYTVVLPDEANHRTGKVSVLAPIGASMLGARIGEDIYWETAAGKRYFTIMSVNQLYG